MDPIQKFFSLIKAHSKQVLIASVISVIVAVLSISSAFMFGKLTDRFTEQVLSGASPVSEEEELEDDEDELDDPDADGGHHHSESNLQHFLAHMLPMLRESRLTLLIGALAAIWLVKLILQYILRKLTAQTACAVDKNLTAEYFSKIISMPMDQLQKRSTGDYLARSSGIFMIRQAVSDSSVTMLTNLVISLLCAVLMFITNKKLFLIALVSLVAYILSVTVFRRKMQQANMSVLQNHAELECLSKEILEGAETIKAKCAEEKYLEKLRDKQSAFVQSEIENNYLCIRQSTLSAVIESICTVCLILAGIVSIFTGNLTTGALITFYFLFVSFIQPVKSMVQMQPMVEGAFASLERICEILGEQTENTADGDDLQAIRALEMQDINFSYDGQTPTLQDINMKITAGQKIGIVGESGSGKTTLARILLRFVAQPDGSISLNNQPLNSIRLDSLRRNIAYVSQTPFLFSDSIRNNLTLCSDADTDKISEICRKFSAEQFISQKSEGYQTILQENGADLSGGQRQRLAIAQALLQNPDMLILDEATSNLDSETENSIKNAVFSLKNLTCVMIAHRLSTVKNCDRIYVMDHGKIAESGTHDELLQNGGKYAALWALQH